MQQTEAKIRDAVPGRVTYEDVPLARSNSSAFPEFPPLQHSVQFGSLETSVHALLKGWSKPATAASTVLAVAVSSLHRLDLAYLALALVTLLLTHQLFSPLRLRAPDLLEIVRLDAVRLLLEWSGVVAVLVFLGLALGLGQRFPRGVLLGWFAATPFTLLAGEYLSLSLGARSGLAHHRHVIIGGGEAGLELARRVAERTSSGDFLGFFDFRSPERLSPQCREKFMGACRDVGAFVRGHAVKVIYIALPMSHAPRIEALLNDLRDTTASIYFVPDLFAFHLVQPRCVDVNGVPLLSICDTPFHGIHALNKRASDLGLAALALVAAAPVMLAAALAVKLSSPGPVLFRQRRHGLHGEPILIYKFRSMTVWEDGPIVEQARRNDARITKVGRFLRRTSLDELPQLFNVLQGNMSFVGPRPHAVVHNELYRTLIDGYMIRHKVRPGITGWAQVHGLRGETALLEQMRLRVQYDIDYLQRWTLWLDVKILIRTALSVLRGRNAH